MGALKHAHSPMTMPDRTPREALLQAEIATLRVMNGTLQAQIQTLVQNIEQLTQDNAVLRLKVDAMAANCLARAARSSIPRSSRWCSMPCKTKGLAVN